MIIKANQWDTKHLNLNVVTVEFDKNDTVKSLRHLEIEHSDYILAKVPICKLELTHFLEKSGFRFIETQFELILDSKNNIVLPKYFERLINETCYKEIIHYQDVEQIFNRIDENLFESDRVCLDPYFSKDIGAKRYRNWIKDEYTRKSSKLFELYLKKNSIGFFMLKKINAKKYFALLAGLYPEYKGSGLGISVVAKPIEWILKNKVYRLVTRNSSNNLQSLKIHLECGYKIQSINYLFRKVVK